MDDDDAYLDSLLGGRPLPLRGNLPGSHSPEQEEHRYSIARTFATTPPDFVGRNKRTQGSRFGNATTENTREHYWNNNHPVLQQQEWNTVKGNFPTLAPNTETKQIKNSILTSFCNKIVSASGTWKDKIEFFTASFEDIVPAANAQSTLAIVDLDDYNTNVFTFNDLEPLDGNYQVLNTGANPDYAQLTRSRTRYFRFALTVDPHLVNTRNLNLDTLTFPSQTTTTVYVRALLNAGVLHPNITKNIIENTPKLLILLHNAAGQEFLIGQKTTYDAAPDPERQKKWLQEIRAKTKYAAAKQIIQTLYVGRLEGTESLAQRLLKISQRGWDKGTRRPVYKTINEVAQEYQYLLQEVDEFTLPAELPELEAAFYQSLSADLQRKLVTTLHANTSTTLIENVKRFNDFIQEANTAEEGLKDITRIAERAAQRQTPRAYTPRTPQGARTFLGYEDSQTQEKNESINITNNDGKAICMPIAFVATHSPSCTQDQQDMMAHAITTMDDLARDTMGLTPLTASSIVEQALQQASGVRAPMKCFGCDGIPEYDRNSYHMWRDCPHKQDKRVWTNFQNNLKLFRDRKAAEKDNKFSAYRRPAATLTNWQRNGFPSQQIRDQIAAIADTGTGRNTRLTLLASLKDSLQTVDLEDQTAEDSVDTRTNKKVKWTKNIGRSFLLYMTPQEPPTTPRTFISAPPLERYRFKIAFKLPFMTFPIGTGATSTDIATLTGLLDTGGCCNMGSLAYHQEIARQHPNLVEELVDLKEKRYEEINIGGLKDGVALTHMIRYSIPYTDKGEQLAITLGLASDLPVDTLFGVGFQIETKMKIDLAAGRVESGFLQDSYSIEYNEPRLTDPSQIAAELHKSPKALISQNMTEE
jgi:hypothetical protein